MIELYGPTVLMDEADTYLHGNGEMAGILNSGHRRGAAYVWRCDASDYHPTRHSTWAPLAFAIIGKVRPPALASRCIIILMRRALPSEVVEALPVDGSDELTTLARKIARWTADNIEALKVAKPAMPQGFRNRLGDNWRPPFAIADLAGGDWPERARKAAMLLSGGNEPPDGTPLLAAIKRIFDEEEAERLPSQKLCQRLSAPDDSDEERPWELMTPKALAAQLKLFGIKSKPVRFGERTLWGYARKDFEDAFRRYLSEDPSETATSATLQ